MFDTPKTSLRIMLLASLVSLGLGSIAAHAQVFQDIHFEWYSDGTFDFGNLPGQSGINTFSSSDPFDLTEVRFHHSTAAGSLAQGWLLYDGTFEITAANGDLLQGYLFPEFHYNADLDMDNIQDGASFFFPTGGTGQFAGVVDGGGLLIGTAKFTSPTSGTVDYYWEGTLTFVSPEPSAIILAGLPLALLLTARRHRFGSPSFIDTHRSPNHTAPCASTPQPKH